MQIPGSADNKHLFLVLPSATPATFLLQRSNIWELLPLTQVHHQVYQAHWPMGVEGCSIFVSTYPTDSFRRRWLVNSTPVARAAVDLLVSGTEFFLQLNIQFYGKKHVWSIR